MIAILFFLVSSLLCLLSMYRYLSVLKKISRLHRPSSEQETSATVIRPLRAAA